VTTLEAGLATVKIHSVVWSHSSTSILAGGEVAPSFFLWVCFRFASGFKSRRKLLLGTGMKIVSKYLQKYRCCIYGTTLYRYSIV
jgi:hypothetical protein